MAFIITSLLTMECLFRIFTCLIAEPIKMIFLFLGWMPPFFIKVALAFEEIIHNWEENMDQHIERHFYGNNSIDCNTFNNTDGEWFSFQSHHTEDCTTVSFKTVEAICFLPTCISQFGTVGTCLFVMMISIVR